MKKNNMKRGFTLTELVIALAVIAVVTTMVGTYIALVRNNNKASFERLDAINEISLAESIIEGWIEDNPSAIRTENELIADGKNLSFADGTLTFGEAEHSFELISSITFAEPDEVSDKRLFICKISYTVSETPHTYVFCVTPYTGGDV